MSVALHIYNNTRGIYISPLRKVVKDKNPPSIHTYILQNCIGRDNLCSQSTASTTLKQDKISKSCVLYSPCLIKKTNDSSIKMISCYASQLNRIFFVANI